LRFVLQRVYDLRHRGRGALDLRRWPEVARPARPASRRRGRNCRPPGRPSGRMATPKPWVPPCSRGTG
jgi:hypothetical protein